MKSILPFSKMHTNVFLIAFLFISTSGFATTFYLKNANVATANVVTSWNTDPTGVGGGANVNAVAGDFANSAHIWVILSGQNAIFANNTTTTIAGTLQVIGTLQVANNPPSNQSTTLTISGTVIFGNTSASQVTLSNAGGNATTTFALGGAGILRTPNVNGIWGTSCSIAPIGNKSAVTLPAGATYEFNGTANQSTTGLPTTVANLIVNNIGGSNTTNVVSLAQATTVTTTVTMALGNLNIGDNNLTVSNISISSPSSSKMIIASGTGELRKRFTTSGSFTFPVGDNTSTTEYSPITLNVTGTSYSGTAYVGIRVTDAKHPNNASATHFLTRYWSVTQSGITNGAASTSANYVNADVSVSEASIAAARLEGTFNQTTNPWEKYGALAANTLTATSETITAGQTTVFTGITNANPTVNILGGNVTVCQNAVTTLTASTTGDTPFSYNWTGLISGSNTIAAVTANTTTAGGPNSYTVTVVDGNGMSATSSAATVTVTASSTPTVSLASNDADNTFCAGTNVTFTATPSNVGGGTVNYDFKVAGNSAQSGASNTFVTSGLTNGQTVSVDIIISGGTCLTTNTANSNTIPNTVNANTTWYADTDNDGYGDFAVSQSNCVQPVGYVSNSTDCDDTRNFVHPGAAEICFNNIDDDCDGFKSEGCQPVIVNLTSSYPYNIQLGTISTTIMSTVPNVGFGNVVTGYIFEITNTVTNQTVELLRPINKFSLTMTNIYAYDTAFDIRVRAVVNGEEQGYLGATGRVRTPNLVSPGLLASQCGANLPTIGTTIFSNSVSGATDYEFTLTSTSFTSPNQQVITRQVNNFRLSMMQDYVPSYDMTYTVSVRVRVDGVWSTGTSPCNIITPKVPTTQVVFSQCDNTISSLNTTITGIGVPYATQYRFKVSKVNAPGIVEEVLVIGQPLFRLNMLQTITADYATSYNVWIQAGTQNGLWSVYDTACVITTPAAPLTKMIQPAFTAVAYPNPFTNNFMLEVKAENQSKIEVKVYDMIGRLVEQKEGEISDLENVSIGDGYPTGIYNVIIAQGEEVKLIRVVKR